MARPLGRPFRLAGITVLALAGAGCSSGQPPATVAHSTTSTTPTTARSTTTGTGGSTTTSTAATARVGTAQTATGASGQQVTATPTPPEHEGYQLGGPPASWALGLIVQNTGTGVFQSVPASQVTLVDGSGRSYTPQVHKTALTGLPSALPAGGQFRMVLIFVLAPGAKPVAVTFTPFGTSGPTLRWAA